VTFSPDRDGAIEAELGISSNDPERPRVGIPLLGVGVAIPGELTVGVTSNSPTFKFGDELNVSISIANAGDSVAADVYLVLTFDLYGPEERHWSASQDGAWIDGISPVAASWLISNGYEVSTRWWSSQLPCMLPLISRSGQYTIRMAAVSPGSFIPVCDISTVEFTLSGEPFVSLTPDKQNYTLAGDSISLTLDAELPETCAVTGDFYAVLEAPNGQLFAPAAFGEDVAWSASVLPMQKAVTLPAGFESSFISFVVNLPGAKPFDAVGQFTLRTALVEPGTLRPLSDIGTASFLLE